MPVFGIDISRWQKGINLSRAMSEGVKFAILKIGGSDGGHYKDSCFETFYEKAKKLGLPVGAYYFGADMNVKDAKASAEHLIGLLKGKQFEYPIYYDVEAKMLKLSKKELTDVVNTFCQTVEDAGYFVGIYASASTFKSEVDDAQLSKFCHWVASWSKKQPNGADMWQFGGETNLLRTNKVACKTCDQDYAFKDYPTLVKETGRNGWSTDTAVTAQTATPAEAATPAKTSSQKHPKNITTPSDVSDAVILGREVADTAVYISELNTVYNPQRPYSMGYCDGNRFSFDEAGLVLSILNGWTGEKFVGYCVTDLSNTGMLTLEKLFDRCKNKYSDFSALKDKGTLLYAPGKLGIYVGETTREGKTYNVAESVPGPGKGVVLTWVDEDGTKKDSKDGDKIGVWTQWGFSDFVDYRTAAQNSYMYNGVDYAPVFDPVYYATKYRDLSKAYGKNATLLFNHFCQIGMSQGKQGCASFDVRAYAGRYSDLQKAFNDDWAKYYEHYCRFGLNENRKTRI